MRSAGLDLIRYVIVKQDGVEVVQFAADKDTAVHLAGVEWGVVVSVEAR